MSDIIKRFKMLNCLFKYIGKALPWYRTVSLELLTIVSTIKAVI